MLVGVAAVAGAMYVAAASGSQQSRGPTAKQFKALKKQVATLSKTLKQVKSEADAAVVIIANCYLTNSAGSVHITTLPVSQFGNTVSSGFLFGTTTSSTPRSALDVDTGAAPQADLQEVNPTCLSSNAFRHGAVHSARSSLLRWAARTP
jgi:hypothetical protein